MYHSIERVESHSELSARTLVRASRRSDSRAVGEPPLLDDGLGQDPEAGYGVEDHKDEQRELAPEGASRVAQEAQRDRMGEIDGDHVPGHDEPDLRVPDEPRPDDAVIGFEVGGAEQVPTPSEGIGDEGEYHLPLDEQVRVVVSHLVGDGDGHEREGVRGCEPPETYLSSPTQDSAQFHKAEIDAEEQQG